VYPVIRTNRSKWLSKQFIASAALLALVPLAASHLLAQDPPSDANATPVNDVAASPAPLLAQISHETQNLFQSVRSGLVVVQLPPAQLNLQLNPQTNSQPSPLGDPNSPMAKWTGRLDPQVLAQLIDQQRRGIVNVNAFVAPATQPDTTQPAPGAQPGAIEPSHPTAGLLIRRPDGETEFVTASSPAYDAIVSQLTGPRFVGMVLDDQGHVLLPTFVDKEAMHGRPIRVGDAHGHIVTAQLIGSDRQTNMTIIKLDAPLGHPVSLAGIRPADGALVMIISATGDSGHLSIWTGGQQERGLLVSTSGSIGGFVRMGQFLSADAIRPVAMQLIQYGKVRRAALGVLVSPAQTPDGHAAMRIEQVIDHSAAADAGLHDGDYILSLAGTPVSDGPTFAAAIAQRDGTTDLGILRDGQLQTITVELKPQ
jgi:hypothetical protein